MSVSPIDTLMQIATPVRGSEPALRAGSENKSFGPVLEQAYAAEKPREREPVEEQEPVDPAAEPRLESPPETDDAADERPEEAQVSKEAPAVGEETDEGEEEPESDEVVISELASTVVNAKEAEAAKVDFEAEAALELAGALSEGGKPGEDGADPATAAKADGDESDDSGAGGAKLKSIPPELLAKYEQHRKGVVNEPAEAKKLPAGKVKATGKPERPAEAAATDDVANKPAEKPISQDVSLVAEQVEKEIKAGTPSADSGKATEGAEGSHRVKLPAIEQTAELAAAIERHVATLEHAGGGDTAKPELSAPAAIEATNNNAASAQRATATLDRLAATSLRRGEAANSPSSEGGPAIDRARFVQRVEGAMRAAQQRDGRVQVRLAPPELGSLRIELSVQNGVMAARLEAETPAARNALLDNLPALRERLAEQNIRVEKFDVDIRRDSQGSGGNSGPHDRPTDHGESGSHERRGRAATPQTGATTTRAPRSAAAVTDAGLDVRI